MDAIIEYDGDKYVCTGCGSVLGLIKERGERTLGTDYKIDPYGTSTSNATSTGVNYPHL